MSIQITNTIKAKQNIGGNREAYIFINGISIDETKNFITTSTAYVDALNDTIEVYGRHEYTGYLVVEDEILNVIGYSYLTNTNTTVFTVARGEFGTTISSHNEDINVYPVQQLNNIIEYTYSQKSDVSDSTIFSMSLDVGSITIKDETINWSAYNQNKKYKYINYAPIFIFEGIDNSVTKTVEGVTTKKYEFKMSNKVKLDFKSSIAKIWDNELSKSKMFYDETVESILNYLFPDYTVEFLDGTDKTKLIKIKNLDLKNYSTYRDFLNALCKHALIRLRFTTNNRIILTSDLYVDDLDTDKIIDIDINKIDDSTTELIFNKIQGTYYETSEYYNPDDFKRDRNTNELSDIADSNPIQFHKTYNGTSLQVIKDREFQTYTFDSVDGGKHVQYGDYVLIKETNSNHDYDSEGREFWGYVIDIKDNNITVGIGRDKTSWLNYSGYIDEITNNTGELTLNYFTLYYGFYYLPTVHKYTIEDKEQVKDNKMDLPVLPMIAYDDVEHLIEAIDADDRYCDITGNYEGVYNYAKIGNEYVSFKGIYYDGSVTQCYIERGALGTVATTHDTNEDVKVIKYNNMLINNDSFSFADIGEMKFSGMVAGIDNIWDTWFDNNTLKYNKEFAQTVPIYLYSIKYNAQDGVPVATSFDNSGLKVKYERGDGETDFKIKIRNSLEPRNESELYSGTPVDITASILTITAEQANNIDAGDILMLKEIPSTDSNYHIYYKYKNVKWRVKTKVNDGAWRLYLDNSWADIPIDMEFIVYSRHDIVYLQELYVRGNPIMQKTHNLSVVSPESIDIYGERVYNIDGRAHTEEDIRKIIDYLKNGYKGIDTTNTRLKIKTNVRSRYDIEALDLVKITDLVYTQTQNQKAICINKNVKVNSKGIRTEELTFITVGNYNTNPANIELEERLAYKTNELPTYTHNGFKIENKTSEPLDDNRLINLVDEATGSTYALKKLSLSKISAKIADKLIQSTDKGTTFNIKDIKGEDLGVTASGTGITIIVNSVDLTNILSIGDYIELGADYRKIKNIYYNGSTNIEVYDNLSQAWNNEILYKNNYRKTLLNPDTETIISVKGEYIKTYINSETSLTIKQRGLFGSEPVDLNLNDEITFYSILSSTTSDTLTFSEFNAGDGVDNYLRFSDGNCELKVEGDILFQNPRNKIYLDKNGAQSQVLIEVTENTNAEFQIGDTTSNEYLKYENGDLSLLTQGAIDLNNINNRIHFDPTNTGNSYIEIATDGANGKFSVGDVSSNEYLRYESGQFELKTTGNVLMENPTNKFFFDSAGNSSQLLLEVTEETDAEFQVGDSAGSHIKWDSNEGLTLSTDKLTFVGSNVLKRANSKKIDNIVADITNKVTYGSGNFMYIIYENSEFVYKYVDNLTQTKYTKVLFSNSGSYFYSISELFILNGYVYFIVRQSTKTSPFTVIDDLYRIQATSNENDAVLTHVYSGIEVQTGTASEVTTYYEVAQNFQKAVSYNSDYYALIIKPPISKNGTHKIYKIEYSGSVTEVGFSTDDGDMHVISSVGDYLYIVDGSNKVYELDKTTYNILQTYTVPPELSNVSVFYTYMTEFNSEIYLLYYANQPYAPLYKINNGELVKIIDFPRGNPYGDFSITSNHDILIVNLTNNQTYITYDGEYFEEFLMSKSRVERIEVLGTNNKIIAELLDYITSTTDLYIIEDFSMVITI